jgi:hypothetical protein
MDDSSTTSRNYINTEHQFSLGLIDDSFALGYHCWWILGFVLSFGLFTIMLAFVAGVLDNKYSPPTPAASSPNAKFMRNLGETDPRKAAATMERISRLEGARRSLGYPMLRDIRQDPRQL